MGMGMYACCFSGMYMRLSLLVGWFQWIGSIHITEFGPSSYKQNKQVLNMQADHVAT